MMPVIRHFSSENFHDFGMSQLSERPRTGQSLRRCEASNVGMVFCWSSPLEQIVLLGFRLQFKGGLPTYLYYYVFSLKTWCLFSLNMRNFWHSVVSSHGDGGMVSVCFSGIPDIYPDSQIEASLNILSIQQCLTTSLQCLWCADKFCHTSNWELVSPQPTGWSSSFGATLQWFNLLILRWFSKVGISPSRLYHKHS